MADKTKTLTEDEQFALLIEGDPMFDRGRPEAPEGDQTVVEDDAAGDDQHKAENVEGADAGAAAGADGAADDGQANGNDGAEANAAAAGAGGGEGQPAAAADPNAQADEPFPGYSTLSDEARAAYDKVVSDKAKAENDYRALHGMTAPLQRGNAELRRQHDALLARIQQLEQVERKQQDVSAAKDRVTKEFEDWAAQYPEESRAVIALVNPLRDQVVALEGSLKAAQAEIGSLHADRKQAALARETEALNKAHPDWRAIHESQEYWDWLNHQSPGTQSLNDSMFAGDAISLLDLFKNSRPKPDQQQPQPKATEPANTESADAVRQRRNQSLARGTQPTVRTTESPARTASREGDMSDEDAQFAALVADDPRFN